MRGIAYVVMPYSVHQILCNRRDRKGGDRWESMGIDGSGAMGHAQIKTSDGNMIFRSDQYRPRHFTSENVVLMFEVTQISFIDSDFMMTSRVAFTNIIVI